MNRLGIQCVESEIDALIRVTLLTVCCLCQFRLVRGILHSINPEIDRTYHRSGDAIVVRGVHDVGTNATRQDKLETKIDSLTTLITQLAINQQKSSMARVCGICTSSDHYSDMCPSLLEPRTGDHPEADVPCTSLYTFHACTDSELCDSCIDEFLNIVVDSPVTHSHCTNTIVAGIRQQSDLFVQVQAATKPSFATFFLSVLQAPDWTPPFDLECDIAVYALGTVLASYEFDFLPP
ncbi:hypothetical protein Lal_00033921 [Lupinus albus]|nr:hypothetical protein Lal_00033921 [Lupinus albus]